MNKKNLADCTTIDVGKILASSDVESVVYFASVSDSCGVVAQTAAGAMPLPGGNIFATGNTFRKKDFSRRCQLRNYLRESHKALKLWIR